MALTGTVQNTTNDLQHELLASRYSVNARVETVLPGTSTAAPKAEKKEAFGSRDWFERSSERADHGRAAIRNLLARMRELADAAAQREAAARLEAGTPPAAIAANVAAAVEESSTSSTSTSSTSTSSTSTTAAESTETADSTSTATTDSTSTATTDSTPTESTDSGSGTESAEAESTESGSETESTEPGLISTLLG